jgi:hypothetical protein
MAMHAISSGAGIFGAAFLLSWAAETGQVDIPEALALAFLALVAVLPNTPSTSTSPIKPARTRNTPHTRRRT